MGCDIHIIGQYKTKYTKDWVDIQLPPQFSNRFYEFFGLLAGVRSDLMPCSEPKGLPEGFELSDTGYRGDIWMGEHSFSYLSYLEMVKFNKKLRNRYDKLTDPSILHAYIRFDELVNFLSYYTDPTQSGKKRENLENVRIVFGFDS